MKFDNLRRQIDKLKGQLPKEIVIRLLEGSEYRHPGPVIEFVAEGLRQAYEGKGPIRDACLNSDQVSISQTSGDHLVELLRSAGHFKGVAEQ